MSKNSKNIQINTPLEVYAATSKDACNTSRAASGGMFMELARPIVEQGGDVFGCVLEDDGTCYIKSTTSLEELRPIQGSKYVNSHPRKTYGECASLLHAGKQVMYFGTPCQIAGLLAYLNKHDISESEMQNLLTVDLFCYGTPPQKLFKLYIQWLNEKHKTDDGIHNYTFRSKQKGWGPNFYSFYFYKNGKKIKKSGYPDSDPYYYAFTQASILQNKCYGCKFSSKYRVADISIGDFWGIQAKRPDFYEEHKNAGISGVLINTEKGQKFFNKVAKNLHTLKSNYEEIRQCSIDGDDETIQNKLENHKKLREDLKKQIADNDYNGIFNDTLKVHKNVRASAKRTASRILPKSAKQAIKKIIK